MTTCKDAWERYADGRPRGDISRGDAFKAGWDAAGAEAGRLRAALKPFAEAAESARISGRPVFHFVGARDYEEAESALEQKAPEKPCTWCGVVHAGMCSRLISGGQSD